MKKWIFCGLFLITMFIPHHAKAALAIGDLVTISSGTRFQGRVNYALQTAAINVMAESGATASHSIRVQFARLVLNGGGPSIIQLCIDVLTNSTIAAEAATSTQPDFAIPDSDIQFAINSLFNALAGVAN